MNNQMREEIFVQAKKWIEEAGNIIVNRINDDLMIDTKAHANDLVTEMDQDIELFFANKIKEKYPTHLLLGEEGYGDEVTSLEGTVWIIDPIDGTKNFVHQKKNFAISVGIFHEGVGEIGFIYNVMADILYSAKRNHGAYKNNVKMEPLNNAVKLEEAIFSFKHDLLCKSKNFDPEVIEDFVNEIRGTRYGGAAALEIAQVAEGIVDGYVSKGLSPWDVAAGVVIINEVGGIAKRSNADSINMLEKGTIVICNDVISEDVFKRLRSWNRNEQTVNN